MTLKQLLEKLALLRKKAVVAEASLDVAENAEDKKKAITEINETCAAIEAVNIEIEEATAEQEAKDKLAKLKGTPEPRSLEGGDLNASDISSHDNVMDDPALGFANFGDLAMSAHNAVVNGVHDPRLAVVGNHNPELSAAGLRQGNGPEGGYLVPPAFRAAMLENDQGMSLDLYGRTRNFNLGQEESITIPALNQTSRKDGSRWGGVTSQWLEEEETMTESEPSFRQVELKPKEIAIFIKVSDKLLRNSPIALSQFLSMASQDEINFKLSDAVISGTGVGKPLGIMNSDALVTVLKKSGQLADTVVVENTTAMMAKMTGRWKNGAVWLINKDVFPQLQLMKIGDTPVFLPAGSVAGQSFATLHGRPIVETEYNEVLGDKGDIIFANLQAYITAQHGGGIRSDSSIHFNFDQNKTAFRFLTEADGQTWNKTALTDYKGSGTTSPFVTLEARA